ncbi:hypothetical protein ACWD3I_46155 [Streptomyces sp. NPDC002817]|uniref:hypothetical protein n=1 Tax=Streptomyces sp. NPDC088357 TaxID=3154655 RepID=UPI003427F97E
MGAHDCGIDREDPGQVSLGIRLGEQGMLPGHWNTAAAVEAQAADAARALARTSGEAHARTNR